MSEFDVDGEIVAEEDASAEDAVRPGPPAARRYEKPGALVLRSEARTAAIAAVGGVLAGAATVAAVRAVAVGGARVQRRLPRRRKRPAKVVASRSFLVDVHLLGVSAVRRLTSR